MEANPDGVPCNVLAMLSKLSHSTAFIGKVGRDYVGEMLKKSIEEAGIDSTYLRMDEGESFNILVYRQIAEEWE